MLRLGMGSALAAFVKQVSCAIHLAMEDVMHDIISPRQPLTADRLIKCEQALEAELQDLIWRAMRAGWDEMEVCTAIATLADHHILATLENAKMEKTIKRSRKKRPN